MYTVFEKYFLHLENRYQDYLDYVVKYGIQGIGVPFEILDDEKQALELAKRVWDLDLRWGVMLTPMDSYSSKVDDQMFEKGLEVLKRHCEVAQKMGVTHAYNHVISSNADREYRENFDWHVRRLERVQKIFFDNNIFYGLEFLGPREIRCRFEHEFIHTIAGVIALADAAGGKAGFLFDTYHWYTEGARMDDLYFASQNVGRMVGFHVNDALPGLSYDELPDLTRDMPMTTGVIDSAMIYKLFLRHGYTGPVQCEPMEPATTQAQSMTNEARVKLFADAYSRISK